MVFQSGTCYFSIYFKGSPGQGLNCAEVSEAAVLLLNVLLDCICEHLMFFFNNLK